jgi:hypothetical protein
MSRFQAHVRLCSIVVLAALAACSKTGSPPGGFGVNVTVDATKVSAADRAKVMSGTLRVASDKAGAPVVTRTLDLHGPIQGGTVRFHYTPGADVAAGEGLTFGLDATGASADDIIASGSSMKAVLVAATAVSATIVLEGSGDGGVTGDGGGKGNGVACVTGAECSSTFCADGVCCNEKCDDVCVSCNQSAATKGMCTPYAAGMDPELECAAKIPTAPSDDAGAPVTDADIDAMADGDAAAPSVDAAASDASDDTASDAATINTPDGGFMTMPKTCGGTCSGARACNYPDGKTSCGTAFCNSNKEVASFVCDGNGGCAIGLSPCVAYACNDATGACRSACAAPAECLADKFCSGNDQCVDKKANGLTCTTKDECKSGYCSTGVCCNTDCGSPFSCNDPAGTPGQCKCPGVTCGAGVACQVYYQDADGDGFGNKSGVVGGTSVTAKAGCAGAAPPGYVADNTDCDDGDANVHPGQTAYFGAASIGIGTFDYNCDGAQQKETPEYPGGVCHFCGAVGSCTTYPATCASGATGSFQCPQESDYRIITKLSSESTSESIELIDRSFEAEAPIAVSGPIAARAAPGTGIQPVQPVIPIRPIYQCCGCGDSDKTGFVTTVRCGDSTQFVHTCGACNTSTGAAYGQTIASKQQRCH